jgi:quercetin dioxygenase-like cupin family protein
MINRRTILAVSGGLVGLATTRAAAQSASPLTRRSTAMQIVHAGAQPSRKGQAENFTGAVRIDPIASGRDASKVFASYVTFEPGARTAWHTHPVGQTLIVTAGAGRVQCEREPIAEIRVGDVVWFPAGVKHWHGASPSAAMTHIAITEAQDGKSADWLELVSDEQYGAPQAK